MARRMARATGMARRKARNMARCMASTTGMARNMASTTMARRMARRMARATGMARSMAKRWRAAWQASPAPQEAWQASCEDAWQERPATWQDGHKMHGNMMGKRHACERRSLDSRHGVLTQALPGVEARARHSPYSSADPSLSRTYDLVASAYCTKHPICATCMLLPTNERT